MSTTEPMSLVSRCKEYFGLLPGQNLMQFSAELKTLSPKDRADLVEGFNAMGLPTIDKTATA